MQHALRLTFALAVGAALVAACGGGGSNGSAVALPPGTPPKVPAATTVTMTVKIPSASATSSRASRPAYVSANTQSVGVVVTNQGASPSPAQFVNVSSCPQSGGVTTCSISVGALPGSDTFALSAYSGQNGAGSVLSTGSVTSTIVAGVANTTMPLTLGGVIASIAVTPAVSTLPLGQATTVNVVAKDASGATIVGTFDNPVTLAAANMTIGKSSVTNSTDAASITAAWSYGFAGPTATSFTASGDGVSGKAPIAPGTGFAYYQTGTNATTDEIGFRMIAGADGNLYYTSLGPVVCTTICSTSTGAVHQFNPTTGTDTEIALKSEGVGLKFTSDGALWIAGGPAPAGSTSPYIYRMAPGAFSSGSLTPIPVPTPTRGTPTVRSFAEDTSGNLWFPDVNGHRILKIPVAGPYTTASITGYALSRGPSGTPAYSGSARNVEFAGGVLMVADVSNGVVDTINTSTGATTGQYLFASQLAVPNPTADSVNNYGSTSDATSGYFANLGDWNAALQIGDIERFNPSSNTFTVLSTQGSPNGFAPGAMSVESSYLYYQELATGGLGLVNLSNNTGRLIPILSASSTNPFLIPNGVAAVSDGTAWFSCYASAQVFQPLCVGHTVYLGGWSVFPSTSLSIYGAGSGGEQIVGIMEAPSANSGPFTVASSNTSVCTIANASDHNFAIVGQSAGACNVTVTDKNNVTQTISVSVTTTSGTVQGRSGGKI